MKKGRKKILKIFVSTNYIGAFCYEFFLPSISTINSKKKKKYLIRSIESVIHI